MRRLVPLAALLALVGAVVDAVGPARADARVAAQAWQRTTPVPTFVAQAGRLYVAAAAGVEEARAYVRVDGGDELEQASLVLYEADDAVLATTAALVACPLTQSFAGDGELSGAPPAFDCSVSVAVERSDDGGWHVVLGSLASRWASGDNHGLVLLPVVAEAAPPWRLSFSVDRTQLALPDPDSGPDPDGGADATSSTTTTMSSSPPPPVDVLSGESTVSLPAPPAADAGPAAPTTTAVTQPAAFSEEAPAEDTGPHSNAGFTMFVMGVILLGGLVAAWATRPPGGPGHGGDGEGGDNGDAGARGGERPPAGPVALAVAASLLPLLGDEVTVYKAGIVVIFFVGVIGLHVLVNWAGQLSLAHAAMVGLPAFVALALSDVHDVSPVYLLPVATAVGALVGGVVALPTLRSKDLQVALVTLVAGIAISRFFFGQSWLVGDAGGRAAAVPRLGPVTFTTSKSLYPVLVAVAFAAAAAAWMLMHSKVSRALRWVRADPVAASAFGIPVVACRISAYALGGAFAGLAGGLTAMWVQRFGQDAFPPTGSFTYLLVAVLAGGGYVGGLAVGALVLAGGPVFASEMLGEHTGKWVETAVAYGGPIGLIVMLTRYQAGLNGLGRNLMARNGSVGGTGARWRQRLAPQSLSFVFGTTAVVAGFVAIGLAWRHTNTTDQLWIQNQEILSGGVGGLGLILVGTGLLVRDRIGQLLDVRRNETGGSAMVHPIDAAAAVGANGARQAPRRRVETASNR